MKQNYHRGPHIEYILSPASSRKENVPSLKSRDQKKVMGKIYLINGLVGNISKSCNSISDVNQLLYACSYVVAEELGLMKKKKGERKAKEDPWWKRRIEKNISVWRKDLSQLEKRNMVHLPFRKEAT